VSPKQEDTQSQQDVGLSLSLVSYRSIPSGKRIKQSASCLRQYARSFSVVLLVLMAAGQAYAMDTYNPPNLQIPAVTIGSATFTNMVVTVGGIVSGPSGSSGNGSVDSYDASTNQLTIPNVLVGANTYHNVVITVGVLVSVASVTGADAYNAPDLLISSVQVGGQVYNNVTITVGSIIAVAGGMPGAVRDNYSGGQLTIPAVQVGSRVFTNVVITVGSIVSVGIAPFLHKPFAGEYLVYNPFDHNIPEEGTDHNGLIVTTSGELTGHGDGHSGFDFPMPIGTPIFAAAAGTVNGAGAATFFCPGLGTVTQLGVQIQHLVPGNPEYWTYYAHFSRVDVVIGQQVNAGQQIGLSGNTGCSTGPHLHFQLERITGTNNGQLAVVDPYGWSGSTTDPWELNPLGAHSVNVWLPGQAPESFIGLPEIFFPLNNIYSGTGTKPVAISAIRYQGAHDELNPNNEYVELKIDPAFFAGATYSLAGHYLKNNAGDRFDFPADFSLAQGQTVRVYVGQGTSTASNLYWGKAAGIFVNTGDCAALIYPDGGYYLLGWEVSCH
jgi:murein DD-endopeptidase MepM/ murein hydrolase activator NlpD